MLTTTLKEYTKKEHASLEKKLITILKNITSSQDYLKVLLLFYGYYKGLENCINQHLDIRLLPDLMERRKAEDILNDIRYIDGEISIAPCTNLPEIKTPYAALGSMYVMEGSTLGGQIISKMIAQKLGLSCKEGLSFFEGYGNRTGYMWEIFTSRINRLSLLPHQEEELMAAAKETFARFSILFDENYETIPC